MRHAGDKVNGAQNSDRLLTEADFRAMLGGMSVRKFKALRAQGVVPQPLELGPRVARWTRTDYELTVARLPRRQTAPEPEKLGDARRARIERLKASGGGGK